MQTGTVELEERVRWTAFDDVSHHRPECRSELERVPGTPTRQHERTNSVDDKVGVRSERPRMALAIRDPLWGASQVLVHPAQKAFFLR